MKKSFVYTLLGTGPNKAFPFIEVPFDTITFFGTRARVPVKVTVNNVELRMSLAPMGGKHVLGFKRDYAEKANIRVGDTVRVTLEKDATKRIVDVPEDLLKALKRNSAAQKAWNSLSYSHQKEHATAIAEAKRSETRARRVEKTLQMLTTSGKPARPRPSNKPLAERLHIKRDMRVAVLSPPKNFSLGVPTMASLDKRVQLVLLFVNSRANLKAWVAKLVKKLDDSAALWIAYPKTTSRKKTDLTRDVGWEAIEREGYSAVTQVAIDETWSALRFRR